MSRDIKQILKSLSLAENMGDVNDEIPVLCELLGLPAPHWSDEWMRYVMAWEDCARHPDGTPDEEASE